MRKGRRKSPVWAWAAITSGLIVLLALILPGSFWWFMLGVALITLGLCLRRWC